jgi:hypothetical protein
MDYDSGLLLEEGSYGIGVVSCLLQLDQGLGLVTNGQSCPQN